MKFVLAWLIAALAYCTPAIATAGGPLDLAIRHEHFCSRFLISELDYLLHSPVALTSPVENYVGLPFED